MNLIAFVSVCFLCSAVALRCGVSDTAGVIQTCNFRLCDPYKGLLYDVGPRIDFGPSGELIPDYLCKEDGSAMKVLRTGSVYVRPDDNINSFVLLRSWEPQGVTSPFQRKSFFSKEIRGKSNTGLVRKEFTETQYNALDSLCVEMAVTKYEKIIRNSDGSTSIMVASSNDRQDCVSFKVGAHHLVVSLFYDSDDNWNFELIEPNGNKLNVRSPESRHGIYPLDSGAGACGVAECLREVAFYPETCVPGQYSVRIFIQKQCPENVGKRVNFKLSVTLKGTEIVSRMGSSTAEAKTDVDFVAFTIPPP